MKTDLVSFTLCPQVHAFDCASLVENLAAQAEVVKSARFLYPGTPVFVSPISLKQRFNVIATSVGAELEHGLLPSAVDPPSKDGFRCQLDLGKSEISNPGWCGSD